MSLYRQFAFTLIELMAVLVIVGILATVIIIRFTPGDIHLQLAKHQVMSAFIFARETAMARSDGSEDIRVLISETGIDVRSNNSSIDNMNQPYPLTFANDVSITSGDNIISFNALGETEADSVTVSDGDRSLTITVSGVGYVY